MQHISQTQQILLARFNSQILIPFIQAAEMAGFAGQTARNLLCQGKFPISTVVVGRRRFIHLADLAEFIEALRSPSPKLGRRTKKARIEAEQAERGAA